MIEATEYYEQSWTECVEWLLSNKITNHMKKDWLWLDRMVGRGGIESKKFDGLRTNAEAIEPALLQPPLNAIDCSN